MIEVRCTFILGLFGFTEPPEARIEQERLEYEAVAVALASAFARYLAFHPNAPQDEQANGLRAIVREVSARTVAELGYPLAFERIDFTEVPLVIDVRALRATAEA